MMIVILAVPILQSSTRVSIFTSDKSPDEEGWKEDEKKKEKDNKSKVMQGNEEPQESRLATGYVQ